MLRNNMNKRHSLTVIGLICALIAVYMSYCLLLRGGFLPFSIASVMTYLNHWVGHSNVLVAGLMPVYIAVMVFGTAILAVYLGSFLHRWVTRRFFRKNK